jgi:hypothetical protein
LKRLLEEEIRPDCLFFPYALSTAVHSASVLRVNTHFPFLIYLLLYITFETEKVLTENPIIFRFRQKFFSTWLFSGLSEMLKVICQIAPLTSQNETNSGNDKTNMDDIKIISHEIKKISCGKKTVSCEKKTISCEKTTISCEMERNAHEIKKKFIEMETISGETKTISGETEIMSSMFF